MILKMILEFILKIKSIFIIKKNVTKVKKRKEQNIWRKSYHLGVKEAKIAMIHKDIGVSDMAEKSLVTTAHTFRQF